MEFKIWKNFFSILSYRKDLINIIKPFLEKLNNNNNNEKFNINEEKNIPFLQSISKDNVELLHYHGIINKEKYTALTPEKELSSESLNTQEMICEILEGDKMTDLQKLIMEKDIHTIETITTSFNEAQKMRIPLIIYSLIKKAIKCFKYLLISGFQDPKDTMKEINPDYESWESNNQYEWDCMALSIYYGEIEIMKILEENGIERGSKPCHLEAAILSYRNSIAKEIIIKMKEKYEQMTHEFLKLGLLSSTKNNNIKGGELVLNNGTEIKIENLLYLKPYKGKRPLHLALLFNSREMAEILISKGADINAYDIILLNRIIINLIKIIEKR